MCYLDNNLYNRTIYDVLSDHKEIMKFSFIAELDCFISAQQDLSNTLKGEQIKHYEWNFDFQSDHRIILIINIMGRGEKNLKVLVPKRWDGAKRLLYLLEFNNVINTCEA